jgi:mannan endo-1,4-beta-mannosidase
MQGIRWRTKGGEGRGRGHRFVTLGLTSVLALLAASAAVAGCRRVPRSPGPAVGMVDRRATAETRALFASLRSAAREHVLFGHQDDLAYGVNWWAEPGRSDVRDVAGDYPAGYGWDLSKIEHRSALNIDNVDFTRMRGWIQQGYRRGGVITISWHADNPLTGGNAWDTTGAVASILPGGARHAQYLRSLDRVADFIGSLRGRNRAGNVTPIPVIFRPFHEMSGGWFWWGNGHATTEQYIQLWRFTVRYLRDRKKLHNIIWAYSPASSAQLAEHYFDWYPGDDYVDLLGFDEYFSPPRPDRSMADQREALAAHLRWLAATAVARGKIPALTETGYVTLPDSTWWTQTLLPALSADSAGTHVAYALVWRNANATTRTESHFFAPYPGQGSASDFVRFHGDPLTWFEHDLPDLYSASGTR